MLKQTFFLRTKLFPPRPVSELLSRKRLTDKLNANLNSPLTLVAADAGCGKTTLIADFIRSKERKSVWYQLDYTDADPFTFIGYITQGIKGIEKTFGETMLAYLNEAKDEILQFPERAIDLLLNEIFEHIEQPFILVLDDYHHIGKETIVHKLVDRLLQYSSEMMHIVITTRDIPPLAIMRHRTRSAALVIDREDLLFTDEEVRELFKNTLNVELRDDEIQEYRERTHGWVTALQLVRQFAEQEIHSQDEKTKIDLKEILQQSEKDIFDYFAEEVFSREDEDLQELLLHLSLLDSMPLDFCSRLFPDKRCAAILPELVQKNVFLTSVGDGDSVEEYRFHPLFQDFLQRHLRSEIGREKVASERKRIAEFFLENNQYKKAIPYLLEAEEFEKSAEIIAEHGEEWLASGAIITLDIYAEKIPSQALEKFPRVLLHQAEVARHQGNFDKSSRLLNRAVKLLAEQNDTTGEAEALYSLASIARRKGEISEAFAFLDKAEKLVSADSETFMKCANTRGLCYAAQGDWSECERQFRVALELAEKLENDKYSRIAAHNLAIPTGFRGEFGEALRWLKRMFREDGSALPQEAWGYLNVGRMHLYRGEFEDAIENLNRSLELCQIYNMKPVFGEIFEAIGIYHRETGNFEQAVEYFERARKAYDNAGLNRYQFELEEEYATYYSMRGDLVKARGFLETLLEERKKIKMEFGIKRVELGLAKIRFQQGETEKLAEELERSLKFYKKQSLNYEESQNSLLLAKVYNAQDNRKKMFEHLQRTLDLSARFDYEYWLKSEILKNPEFFNDEDVIEKLPLDLRENLSKAKPVAIVQTPISVSEPVQALADLTINILGPIEIFRETSKPFPSEAWTTRRARDILCCIASSRNRRVEKDILIDTFWGEEDLAVIEKNFHPTISHIRKALNFKQTLKMNFLVFRDGAYQLNPEFSYKIDTEDFENLINDAEKTKREGDDETFREKVEAAHELYRGEFMSGVYENWAEERRLYSLKHASKNFALSVQDFQ